MTTTRNSNWPSAKRHAASAPARPQKKIPRRKARQKKRPGISLRPRVHLGEAMRAHGVDEHKIAKTYAVVLHKLTASTEEGTGKLLVDVLDKISRVLEPRPAPGASGDAPVAVNLIHFASRPPRP